VIAPQIARQKLADNERIIPPHAPGMRIGLFGGTFDPPHQAHLDATLLAMKRLKLDRVWWLVTPGNPLKNRNRTRRLLPPTNPRRIHEGVDVATPHCQGQRKTCARKQDTAAQRGVIHRACIAIV
jgi:hypothetical protein